MNRSVVGANAGKNESGGMRFVESKALNSTMMNMFVGIMGGKQQWLSPTVT